MKPESLQDLVHPDQIDNTESPKYVYEANKYLGCDMLVPISDERFKEFLRYASRDHKHIEFYKCEDLDGSVFSYGYLIKQTK